MKTMKHFSLFLVLVVLTVSVFSVCAFADASGTDGSLDWSVSGGTLSITGNGMMDNYTLELLPEWYAHKDSITSVTIGADVKSIGSYAFYGLTGLNSITVSGNITSVGYGAFEGTNLVTNGYVQIGSNYVLVKADKSITSFSFNANTVAIAEGAFENCTSLTSISIPETVVSIGDEAFKGCTSLSEITFAVTPDYLGVSAFDGCSLTTTEENGALYIADKKILLSVVSDDVDTIVINENTEVIAPLAFDNCKNLTNIVLPNKIKYIGNAAFYGCSSLYSVTLPDSIVAVGDLAFANCTALTTVDLKEIVAIGNGAFKGTLLKEVVIPATVESLGYNAFRDCTSLETVGIANGVKSIGYKTFEGCTALVNVYLPDSLVSVGDYAFMNCSAMKNINLPTTIREVGFGAFASCSALEKITLPFVDENTYIGYAFGAVNAENNAKAVPASLNTVLASGVTSGVDFGNVIYDSAISDTLTAAISNADLQMGEMIDLSTITATLGSIDTVGLVRLDSNPVVAPAAQTTVKVYVGSHVDEITVSYTDNIRFTDYNLLLEGNIGVKLYVQLTPYAVSNISDLKATVDFKDKQDETAELVNAGKADNPYLYYIKYNIAAKEMLESITFTVTTPDAEITETVTVKGYVDDINGSDSYKDSAALINAMYDFGEYARKYFTGEDIAPKFDVTTATVTISDSVKAVKSGSVDGIQIYSSSLLFESNTSIRHYFKLTGDKAISDYTFTLDDGTVLDAEQKGDYYYVEVSDIPSHKLDKIRMVTVSDGTSDANYFYSPLTYAKIVIDRNLASDADLVNALKAFYLYFSESKAYYDFKNKVEVTPGENEAPGQIW